MRLRRFLRKAKFAPRISEGKPAPASWAKRSRIRSAWRRNAEFTPRQPFAPASAEGPETPGIRAFPGPFLPTLQNLHAWADRFDIAAGRRFVELHNRGKIRFRDDGYELREETGAFRHSFHGGSPD